MATGRGATPDRRRAGAAALDAGILAGLLALTWWVGVRTSDFVGLPKGGDALDHASTIQLLMQSFPHLLWNPAWFGGLPSVPGLYPPLYDLTIAAIVSASGLSIQHAMVACTAATYFVLVASLYGFVRVISRSRVAALLAGLLVLAVPAFWEPSLQVGEYPRLTAMGLAALATFLAALYTAKPKRLRFVGMVLAIGCALATHPITGAIGALQVLGVLLFVPCRSRMERIRAALAAAALMVGLAAWLYLPSLIGVHAYYILPQAKFTTSSGTSFGYLLYPQGLSLRAFSPMLFPFALLMLAIAAVAVWRSWATDGRRLTWSIGASAAMMVVVVCVLAYAYVGRVTHANVELIGVYPYDMFSYAAWPLAATGGVLVGGLVPMVRGAWARWWRVLALSAPCAGAIVCLIALTPVIARGLFDYHHAAALEAPLLPGADGTQQYRIALTDSTESSWINVFTRTPEVGGPFNQGALNLDHVSWAESILTDPSASLAETKFVAQWEAVRWIEAQLPYSVYPRNPAAFRSLGPSGDRTYRNYEVRQPSPILAATDTPPVLVIGPYASYDLVLQSMAVSDVGPNRLVPVEGSPYIDDYSLTQLEQFPVIFLYGFEAHSPDTAAKLLAEYVRAGGGVVADIGGNVPLATQLAKDGAPLPVDSWAPDELHGSWRFDRSRSTLVQGVDLTGFSPALYAGVQPYLVDTASRLSSGAGVVLASHGRPLVVEEGVGTGVVIESGMNLPYHDAVYSNVAESSLLARMMASAVGQLWAAGRPAPGAAVMASDSDSLQVGSADGVLFKETDTPDWHVSVNGRSASIFPAGPGFMYVRLSPTQRAPATVLFRYQLSTTEWASILLSVLTALVLLGYLMGLKLPRQRRREQQRERRGVLEVALDGYDPAAQVAAISQLHGEHLEPYADLLLRFTLLELEPDVLAALLRLVEASASSPTSSGDLAALRIWVARQREEAAPGLVHSPR